MGAALPEAEAAAKETLSRARTRAGQCGMPAVAHVERTRELGAGILQAAKDLQADVIVAAIRPATEGGDPRLERVLNVLLQEAEGEVVIDRAPTGPQA